MISTQSRSTRHGFSLIEVAIALVIFVIGALAIIRIFPGALNVINNNGDQQIATNLNRDIVAKMKTEGAVPSATFNIGVNADGTLQWTTQNTADHTTDFEDINASVIGVPRFNATLPTTDDINLMANNSSLSRFRGIVGEQAQVISIGGEYYALTQFPISAEKINGGTTDTLLQPTVSLEYTVRNARINNAGTVTFQNATTVFKGQEYPLNYTAPATPTPEQTVAAGEIAARNNIAVGSVIYVSYRYGSGGNVWGVQEEATVGSTALILSTGAISVAPPTTATAVRGAITNANSVVAEAIDVRVKSILGAGTFGAGTAIEQATNARCGLIRLPTQATPRFTADNVPEKISVDYVADWSRLMSKGEPSIASNNAAGARQIALGAPFIDDQIPVGIYALLMQPQPSTPPSPVEQYSITPGQFGTEPSAAPGPMIFPDASTPDGAAAREDDLRAGRVSFNSTANGSRVRVAYRTRDNWVQQCSVAANTYTPYARRPVVAGGTTPIEPWRDYYLGNDNYLYFHAGEAGKTASISYTTSENGGTVIVSRPFIIESQIINAGALVPTGFLKPSASPVPRDLANAQIARVKLTYYDGSPLPGNTTATPNLISIQGVRGVSITSRTAYISGSKYAQTLLTSNRGTNQ